MAVGLVVVTGQTDKFTGNDLQNGGTQERETKTQVDFTFLPTFFVKLSLESLDEVSLVRGGEEEDRPGDGVQGGVRASTKQVSLQQLLLEKLLLLCILI